MQGKDPTGRMEPYENERFLPSQVKHEIELVVQSQCAGKTYNSKEAQRMAQLIASEIRDKVKSLNIPSYKLAVQTVVGECAGQGVKVASKCLWDEQNDNFATYSFTTGNIFCTAFVFGFYWE